MHDDWDEPDDADVVLVMRGLYKYRPKKNHNALYIMWNISHPEDISDKEYDSYDLVFVASNYYTEILRERLHVPVYPLLQCTDTSRFYITDEERKAERNGLLFIGNSRLDGRMCVNWAASGKNSLRVFGKNWQRRLVNAEKYVVAESIENKDIRKEYIKAKATLNNHWAAMKSYQFVNNRILDALACELPVVSDRFDELYSLFPNEILYYEDRASFFECLDQLSSDYDAIKKKVILAQERIQQEFSFDARAKTLISSVENIDKSHEFPKEKDDPDDRWTIVLLWKQNDTGIFGRRHEMLMKYFAEDDRIRKIIIFDRPINQKTLDNFTGTTPYSRNWYILQRADEKFRGRKVDEKIVQYNYIIPRGTKYNAVDYKNYIRKVFEKEQVGDEKIALWACPKIYECEPFLEELNIDLFVTDFIDDEREFVNDILTKEKTTANYSFFLKKSDIVFCNCKTVQRYLADLCPWKTKDIHVIPNAAEPFDGVISCKEVPARLAGIPHPIIGYTGNLSSHFDVDLVNYVSKKHPEWHFVIIGSTHLDRRILQLKDRRNIHLLGVVPYDELPAYIINFDVAIMPHIENPQSSGMNPLKLYVYALYRKPIVCSRVSNIEEVSCLASVASSYNEFENMISLALINGSTTDENTYRHFLEKENWRKRKEQIFHILFDH